MNNLQCFHKVNHQSMVTRFGEKVRLDGFVQVCTALYNAYVCVAHSHMHACSQPVAERVQYRTSLPSEPNLKIATTARTTDLIHCILLFWSHGTFVRRVRTILLTSK